jgi:predicted helicase
MSTTWDSTEVAEESIIIQTEPKEYQKEVIDRIEEFYQSRKIGKILWSCGLGKSLLSIFALFSHINSVIY